jgi:NADH dehydrogenase/NADH:ubiquinone oxidoreductase subunit G
MVRRRGEPGFTRVGWDKALDLIAGRIRASSQDRLGFYLTSRGEPNENYFAAQKAVRAIGTNSIDNAARVCHSPSTVSLKQTVGVAATTCSYSDLIGTDLIVFIGSNVANNQPVMMKYLYHAKREGTKVALVNPYEEPGIMRYWVLSNDHGELRGCVLIAPVKPGNVEIHWPEGEVLIDSGRRSPQAGIPDYNAVVSLERAATTAPATVPATVEV